MPDQPPPLVAKQVLLDQPQVELVEAKKPALRPEQTRKATAAK